MRVDLDKFLDKGVFHTIKTAIGYPPEPAWNKISYANFHKLTQITKKNDSFGQVVSPFDIYLKQHFSHSELFAPTSQIIDFLLDAL